MKEIRRLIVRPLAFTSALAFAVAGCASGPGSQASEHAGRGPSCACAGAGPGSSTQQMPDMERHLRQMKDLHARMANARTLGEREALMAEHMKAMEKGMAMMEGTMQGCRAGQAGHPPLHGAGPPSGHQHR